MDTFLFDFTVSPSAAMAEEDLTACDSEEDTESWVCKALQ